MIDAFYYSIAGKKTNQLIDDHIISLLESPYVPEQEKRLLKHCQEVAKDGNYPAEAYFTPFYQKVLSYNSLAEITKLVRDTIDFYHFQSLQRDTISAINDSNSTAEFVGKLSNLLDTDTPSGDDFDLSQFTVDGYDMEDKPTSKGIMTGVKELDDLTYGGQPGTIGSICAFTGHGKTVFTTSMIYKNVMAGEPTCLLSLEMAPELMWQAFEARYMYQEKGLSIDTQDIRFHKMPQDIKEKVEQYRPEFKEAFKKLMIIDESLISLNMMLNYKNFSKLMRSIANKLGGLKFLAIDHVGQFELLYPTHGNQIIKQLQSFSKTFTDQNGDKPFTLFAVQTNREGEKRARKRNYVYDIQAISDLNEIERTSSYIWFLYSDDAMKIMQECRMTMAKNRLGLPLPEPAVVNMNPAVSIVGATVQEAVMDENEWADLTGGLSDLGNLGGFDEFG